MNSDAVELITSDMKKSEEEFEEECAREQDRIRKKLEEEQDAEQREQQYKRLMHLLTRSKFYTQFMMEKLDRRQKELKENCLTSDSEVDKSNKGKTNIISDRLQDTTNRLQSNSLPGAKEESDTKDSANTKKRKRKPNSKYDIADIIDAKTIEKVNAQKWPKEELGELNPLSERDEGKMRKTAYGIMVSERQPYFLEGGALRPYQLDSLDWLRVLYENGVNGILADEMGLGKTIQAIALFCHLVDKSSPGPFLVVAPLSTLPNWLFEFERFAPRLPVVLFHGDKEKRTELYPYLTRRHMVEGKRLGPVVLTSYQIAAKERILGEIRWSYLVVDEGHRLKNFNCLLGRVLREFKSENRLLLTGTPIQNDLSELWSMLNFLMPDVFDDLAVFESWFNVSDLTQSEGNAKILKQEEKKNVLTIMHQILTPFLLRRVKADVQLDIPPKKEILVYAPMSPIQLELYRATVERNYAKLLKNDSEGCLIIPDEPDGSRAKRRCSRTPRRYDLKYLFRQDDDSVLNDTNESILEKSLDPEESEENIVVVDKNDKNYKIVLKMQNPMMQLRKIVNHPYLVHFPLVPGKKVLKVDEELVNKSGKLQVLDAMLAKLKERGHKVLLFSTFTMLLDIIEEYLLMREYKYVRLDGSVSLEQRQESIKTFNTDPNIFIFIISTRAGGLGINLTAADTVIIYDSDWNPQVDLQAQDRCHRIGQTKPVVVYRFVTAGTVDEQIVERAAAKRKLEKMVIHKGKFKLNKTEQQELVSLCDLMELLNSRDHQQVIHSNGYVFTNDELDALLDRSDLMSASKENVSKGKEMDNVYKVLDTKVG